MDDEEPIKNNNKPQAEHLAALALLGVGEVDIPNEDDTGVMSCFDLLLCSYWIHF